MGSVTPGLTPAVASVLVDRVNIINMFYSCHIDGINITAR